MKTQNFYLAGMILITAALLAAPGAAMGEIIDHNQVTYLNNTPLNLPADANYAARSDSNSESADQLADGVAVPGGTTHVDPNLVFWQEDRSANPAYPDPGWDDGVDDAVWDGGYYPNTTFNLGAVYTNLASIQMWYGGWNGAGIGGPVGIKVSFSLDDATYSTPVLYNSAPEGYVKNLSFSYHTATEAIGYEDLSGFQYINIEWQPVDDGTTQTGMLTMGEVTFDGTPIPEPTTVVLLTIGGVVTMLRRRLVPAEK